MLLGEQDSTLREHKFWEMMFNLSRSPVALQVDGSCDVDEPAEERCLFGLAVQSAVT